MAIHFSKTIEWIIQQADLGQLSTLFGATESAIGICVALGGGIIWVYRRLDNYKKRLRYTISCIDSTGNHGGWIQYLHKEKYAFPILWSRYPSSIPGSYYPRNASIRKPLSWPFLISMRLKAAIYRIISRSPPFRQHPAAYFRNDSYAGLDPVFDVLIENTTNKDMTIIGLGIEICCVAYIMNAMGSPPARKIESIGAYQVNMPDINEEMRQRGVWSDGRVLETQSVNEQVFVNPFSDRISLEAGGHMRFTLQLNGYTRNVPTESVIRLFVKSTNKRRFWSDYIRLSHIGADD
jgi:hypothetical protein